MISLNFQVSLPIDRFGLIWGKSGKTLFPHKFWELNTYRTADVIMVEFSWTTQQDHYGLTLKLGGFGYNIEFIIYDNRHWDYETEDYVVTQ